MNDVLAQTYLASADTLLVHIETLLGAGDGVTVSVGCGIDGISGIDTVAVMNCTTGTGGATRKACGATLVVTDIRLVGLDIVSTFKAVVAVDGLLVTLGEVLIGVEVRRVGDAVLGEGQAQLLTGELVTTKWYHA